ncbi:MAG: hypothetical protein ACK5RL_10205 [Acidimicrobiales bacterium]
MRTPVLLATSAVATLLGLALPAGPAEADPVPTPGPPVMVLTPAPDGPDDLCFDQCPEPEIDEPTPDPDPDGPSGSLVNPTVPPSPCDDEPADDCDTGGADGVDPIDEPRTGVPTFTG